MTQGRRRWLLIGLGSVFGMLLLCGALGLFVGVPAFRKNVRASARDGIATEAARQIPAPAGQAALSGDYTVTAAELQQSLRANISSRNVEDVLVRIAPSGIAIGFTTRRGDVTYTGMPVATDGRLDMQAMRTDSRILSFIFPAGDFATAIENAVNGRLAENQLRLTGVQLADGELTLQTVAAP